MNKKIFGVFLSAVFVFILSTATTHAATIFTLPKSAGFNIGQEFTIDLKINAANESVNAAQATVKYPTDILTLLSTDKTGSAFNFWVQEPTVSADNGTLSFIGGTTRGISGESLQVIQMKFKTRGAGVATLSVSDAVVTANDGAEPSSVRKLHTRNSPAKSRKTGNKLY